MGDQTNRRSDGYPNLTSQRHWKNYALGLLTEMGFVLALIAGGVVLAVIALVVT